LIEVYTADSENIGSYTVTVIAKLSNYDSVAQVSADFTIVIDPCIVTSFTMALPSA